MASIGDLQLLLSENQAQALERASCAEFSEFFPFGLSHPKPTLRNSTFIHLGPPPEAPRPWHSALGVKRAKGARKPQRSISGTDVQFRCDFAASQHRDGQADEDQSTLARSPSPRRHAAVDTSGVNPKEITVNVPTGHKRKRLDLCQLQNIPLASKSTPGLDPRTAHNSRASAEREVYENDLRTPQLEPVRVSQPLALTQTNASSAINGAAEPGRMFRDEAGRKRLMPIPTSLDEQIPTHDSSPSPERRLDLRSSTLVHSPDFEETRLGKKSRRLASQIYLGLESLPVDHLFYDKARFGDMLDTRIPEAECFSFSPTASGITGQQLYVHSRIKHYLRSQPMSLFSGTERRLGRFPYPSWIGKKKMPLSVTTFSRSADHSIAAFRSKRVSWHKGSWDTTGSAHNNVEKSGLFDVAEIASETLDLDDELKGLEKWKFLDDHQHILPAYGDSGSEGEYDMDTWKEMEDEADRKLERPERKSRKLVLDLGEVQNTIALAMEAMIAEWKIRKRPKLEAKAWRIWTKARRDKTLHYQVGVQDGRIKDLEQRIKKLCARIVDEPWSTTTDLTRQCKIMEVSIFDLEELKWAREILLNPLAPKKARISVWSNKRASKQDFSARDVSPLLEGEEILPSTSGSSSTSGDELGDFIVSDEDDSGSLRPAAVCDSDTASSTIEEARDRIPVANNQQPASLPQRPHPRSPKPPSPHSKHLSHNIIDLTLDPETSESVSRISTPIIDSDSSSGIWRRGKKTAFRTPPQNPPKEEVVDLVSSPDMDCKFLSSLPKEKRKSSELPKTRDGPSRVFDERLQYTEHPVVKARQWEKRERIVFNPKDKVADQRILDPRFGNGRALKPHQVLALQKIWGEVVGTNEPGHGYILAHTMGLGKTATIIAVLQAISQIAKCGDRALKFLLPESFHDLHALILCPAHLVKNWVEELRRWLPVDDHRIQTVQKVTSSDPIKDRIDIVRHWIHSDGVLVMAYTMFKDLVDEPAAFRPDSKARDEVRNGLLGKTALVIVDEAHSIKNPQSDISQAVGKIRTRRRIGLTGSPLSNNLAEYFALINWAAPGHLGTYDQFRARYEKAIELLFREDTTDAEYRLAIVALKALQKVIEPRVNRADSSTLDHELFGKEEFLVRIPLSRLQFDLYQNYTDHLGGSYVQEGIGRWKHIRVLQLLCLHPSLLVDDLRACGRQELNFEDQLPDNAIDVDAPIPPESYVLPENDLDLSYQMKTMSKIHTSTETLLNSYDRDWTSVLESYKMQVLLEIVDHCSRFKDKVLIFSQRKPVISYVAARLRKEKFDVVVIEGQVHPEKRQEISEKFNKSENFQVGVVSTLAGGVGLNLYGANRVIVLDEGYNPTHEEQAIGRAYRIGQRKKVYVYRLVCAGTIEDAFRDQGILKGNLAARVLDRKVAREKNIRGNGRSPKVVGPKLADYEDLSDIQRKDRLLDQMLVHKGRNFIASITSLHSYRPEDTEELTAAEELAVEAMHDQETLRLKNQQPGRPSTSRTNGSRGQPAAPPKPSPGLVTASATADVPRAPAVAKPTPVALSWPSLPATAPDSRASSLPSMPATSNHAAAHSNARLPARLPAPAPRTTSQPADSTNEPLQPLQPLQPHLQSTKLVRFRMDAPNSQGSGPNKRQKLE